MPTSTDTTPRRDARTQSQTQCSPPLVARVADTERKRLSLWCKRVRVRGATNQMACGPRGEEDKRDDATLDAGTASTELP